MEKLKKFRKIFAVLFGVSVLMLGSVGVLAADKTSSSADLKKAYSVALKSAASKADMSQSEFLKKYPYIGCSYNSVYIAYSFRENDNVNDAQYSGFDSYPAFGFYGAHGVNSYVAFVNVSDLTLSKIYLTDYGYSIAPQSAKLGYDSKNIVFSNYDVHLCGYNTDNKDKVVCSKDTTGFFPRPPIAERAGVLPAVVAEKVETILPVAVCCLALLTFSTILLKRLPRFLG